MGRGPSSRIVGLALVGSALLVLLGACGAKSALEAPRESPAPQDASPPVRPDLGPDLSECLPAGPETCDGVDQDCDGRVDEGLPLRPLGESILIRDVDQGDTGDCDTCAWVRDLSVESTSAGMVAAWHLGFLGTAPQPNAYVRQLGHDGTPAGALTRLDDLSLGGHATSTPHRDGMLWTYCGRVPGTGDDITMRTLLGPTGEPFWEERAEPRRRCGAWSPASITTDSRIVTAWTDNSSGPVPGHEHLVDVAGLDGTSLRANEVAPEADGRPGLALGHGIVVHVAAVRTDVRVSELRIQPYLPGGDPIGEPTFIEALAPETFYGEPWVVPTASGFTVHLAEAASDPGGRMVLYLDRMGRPLGAPERLDIGDRIGIDHVLPFRGGAVMGAQFRPTDGETEIRVLFLDAAGRAYGSWDPLADDPAFGGPIFVEHRGRLFVAYRRMVESRPRALVQIRLWPLGCE